MMQVLFDTNIVLDALLKRAPWETDAIVTRDKAGFQASTIAVLTPTELLAQLNLTEE